MENKNFLFEYLNANSPSGFETEGQKIWLNYIKPYIDDHIVDTYGTTVGVINPKAEYKVVIEAHADEISWYVNYINKSGYIYVIRNGGSDYQIAPSMRAKVHTEKGSVPAIFGWPAIHLRNDAKNGFKPGVENIVLDCGCNSIDEVKKLGIDVGSVVTFDADLMELSNGYIAGRALDNRIGGFMIAEVARMISENKDKIPFGLYIVNAVQEEVGLRGAGMIANNLKPNVAIVTDVTHDTQSPLYSKIKDGDLACKKGPVLAYAPSVQRKLLSKLIEVANKNKIPYQKAANSRYTGTDTDAFAYSNSGVASALISLPLKYMHTTVETIHESDIDNVIKLIYQFIIQHRPEFEFKYF